MPLRLIIFTVQLLVVAYHIFCKFNVAHKELMASRQGHMLIDSSVENIQSSKIGISTAEMRDFRHGFYKKFELTWFSV